MVGAGAAGLSAAYWAREAGLSPLVLDRAPEVGGAWRDMPETLVCLSPRGHDLLPDGDTPQGPGERATRREVLELLQRFQRRHRFRVQSGTTVRGLERRARGLAVETDAGPVTTTALIVATGEFARPWWPECASGSAFRGPSVHYRDFRSADVSPGERVVIVGGGNSGAEAALAAVARGARVSLAATPPPVRPPTPPPWLAELRYRVSGVPLRLVPLRGCTEVTPVALPELDDAVRAGRVALIPRVVGVDGEGVRVGPAATPVPADRLVWCTGFRRETEWLRPWVTVSPRTGIPAQAEGLSDELPGLGFVGIPCMRTRRSGFLRGFSDDAAFVVRRLAQRR